MALKCAVNIVLPSTVGLALTLERRHHVTVDEVRMTGEEGGVEPMVFPTSCSLWNTTTRPPLSPVANSSPDELNSTVEIMSAGTGNRGDVSVDGRTRLSRLD